MSRPITAPYGSWASPLSAEMLSIAHVSLMECRIQDGRAYWLEGRPEEEGRVVLVTGDPYSEPADLTPTGFSVRTKVHEYGGGAYLVHAGTVFFSNFADQRLYRHDPVGDPVAITPETSGRHRFADGRLTSDARYWIGVRERHSGSDRPQDVVNELVAVPTDGSSEPRVIAEGRDFYSNPRISPDGARLCFLAWDLPWMPWDGCELFVAELGEGGELGPPYRVAGRDGRESIWQPEWSPSGDLVFASDRSGWWNLELVRGEERRALHPAESEFGFPAWTFGDRSFDFLSDGRLACIYERGGIQRVALLDLETADLADLDLPHTAIHRGPSIAAEGSAVVFIAGSPTIAPQVVWLDLSSRSIDVLRDSSAQDLDSSMVSVPRQIEFPTENGLTAHAHFYSPKNPSFVGPAGERPPLMVMSHGGPTGESTAILDLAHQFWTSRGFAVVDVNYGGSTGFGRAYRERLYGRWGVVDTQDCINAARYLVSTREVDSERLVIRGGSAGGYTTLCALAFYDAFAAGTSYYGVSDLEPFAQGQTHKFESQYEHTLIGPYPEAKDIYRERSPIHFVDRISCPMLLLQGAEDEVVPPAQSEIMVRALERNGLPHAYILFEGEQHGFRKATSIMAALEAELSFYGQILGFEPAGKLERLDVRNLD